MGSPFTPAFRVFLHDYKDRRISPWMDIPWRPLDEGSSCVSHTPRFHFVNEIPRFTSAKMEMNKWESFHPIWQDRHKDGQLRFLKYRNGKIPFNYGYIPQTWESDETVDPVTGLHGDNDPVDCVELSEEPHPIGSVHEVRILGALALIDEGAVDWKLLCLSVGLEGKQKKNANVPLSVPSALADDLREWFLNYKTAEGKPKNRFALNGEVISGERAAAVATHCHLEWSKNQSRLQQLSKQKSENTR